ncbi:MAG: arsenate reductase (thioredoxin) [Actinobacteria bacterium]|nr:arsenate reductase (thioredoxin) [Actinomycetota bacterium]
MRSGSSRIKVLFLCTGNSARSQIAEGFAHKFGEGFIEPHSAGFAPQGINPKAVAVMKELEIDISNQKSKAIDEESLMEMDVIITLCGDAEESCPLTPPQIKRFHWPIKDPAKATGTDEEIMKEFRSARDEIKKRVIKFVEEVKDGKRIS